MTSDEMKPTSAIPLDRFLRPIRMGVILSNII